MKYLVEINSDSDKGSKLIKFIEELGATESEVHFLQEPPLTDEEMGLPPTRRVSEATLDAWLKPDENEEIFTEEEAFEYIKERRKANKKSEKDESGI